MLLGIRVARLVNGSGKEKQKQKTTTTTTTTLRHCGNLKKLHNKKQKKKKKKKKKKEEMRGFFCSPRANINNRNVIDGNNKLYVV
jgi:hypothetical protein